jgi:hypothetical protein
LEVKSLQKCIWLVVLAHGPKERTARAQNVNFAGGSVQVIALRNCSPLPFSARFRSLFPYWLETGTRHRVS